MPDVRPYLRRSALMVAPLNIARGTQNKILEAMAMGVPVVTSRVAAGGVDASAPEHFLVASTPDEYAAAILRVLDDRGRAQAAVASRAARACCRITPGSDRCSASTVSSSAVLPNRLRTRDARETAGSNRLNISIFGLGYVGAVSLACLARDGHRVVGVDVDQAKLDLIARRQDAGRRGGHGAS